MTTVTQENRHLAVETPLGTDVLLLQSFAGSEEISRLFSYDLELLSEEPNLQFEDLIGQNITVRLELPSGETRYFNGYISRLALGPTGVRFSRYRATVVPWLWFLTRSADCRIFQDMTVPDIIQKVCSDHGFTDIKNNLTATYKAKPYCVQYRETAFAFLSRLMEHEGIHYFFTHENGKHSLTLCDSSDGHTPVMGEAEIPFREEDAADTVQGISDWAMELELQTGVYALGDFDFTATAKDLNAKALTTRNDPGAKLEVYDQPGDYDQAADGETYAKIRLQELEAHAMGATGVANIRSLAAGSTFTLAEHPREDQNKKYLITSVAFEFRNSSFDGTDGEVVRDSARFSALDADVPFRPRCTTEEPVIQGPQTAFVVGPSGEEIYTDEHGRVKVMFHWDRYGAADENSSCWVRVAQVWAGKGWGSIFTPRIGQEVVVEFLEGDPDRPLITGRVYNGAAKPPYPLPDKATVSTLKTSSSKGGAGFNEIRFEDKKGEEEIYVHAEKNAVVKVKADTSEWVGNNRTLYVKMDQVEKVDQDRQETVKRNHIEQIGGDRSLTVTGKEKIEITGAHSEKVTGDVTQVYEAKQSTTVTGDLYIKAANIVIEADTNITLKVGGSHIAIEAGGIKVGTTGDIVVEATGKAGVKGTAGLTLESPANSELKGGMTTVSGDSTLTLKGGSVMIN